MSTAEVLHRVLEQLKRSISRLYFPKNLKYFTNGSELPKLLNIHKILNNMNFNQQLIDEWESLAESVTKNKFHFLGVQWPQNIASNIWHFDPVTKNQWPSDIYCFQINYRNTELYGDVKYVWELNRLQFLQPISILAFTNNDKHLSQFCLSTLESWIDNNPPFQGINWSSGIELACRIVSILMVISCIDRNLISVSLKSKINKSLAIHGYWLMRYPSRYSSSNNHLISEASALYILGIIAPYLPNAKNWKTYGKKILIKEADKQIYSDGVGVEQSPTYTAFSIEWLLLCTKIGESKNDYFPDTYTQRIEKAGEHLKWITDKLGHQPSIGDNDEGKVFFSKFGNEPYATSILSCIANATQRKDLQPPIEVPHVREIIFGKSICSKKPLLGLKRFEQGGYTVSRTQTNNKEHLLIMDHGPLGYLSIAAHGHADALSIWLHIDGQPVLVDAGTYLYHSGANWREHMRGTIAHNTLCINKANSSQTSGAFNWSTKANCSLTQNNRHSNNEIICAQHDGYQKKFNVYHKRKIELLNNSCFSVTDSLHGDAKQLPVEIGFLIHPKLELQTHNGCWIVSKNNQPVLKISQTGNILQSIKIQGEKDPLQGWYSDAFGEITPTPQLLFNGMLRIDQEVIFNFKPMH